MINNYREDSEIAFTKDVLRKVSKDLKLDDDTVDSVYSSLLSYMRHLNYNTDCTTIFLPSLGTMYIKNSYLNKKINRKGVSENFKEVLKSKKDKIKKHAKSMSKWNWSRHYDNALIKNPFYTDGKSLQEIEKIQNERD